MINQRGMSLIELLGIISIMSVVAAICGPPWVAFAARQQGWAAVREFAGELRVARQVAMSGHTRVQVEVDVRAMTLRTRMLDDVARPVRLYDWRHTHTVIESMSNGSQITFYSSGRLATPTTIVLRDRHGNKRTITISLTGKITIS